VETVYNLYRAINGEAVTHKYVTVAGEVAEPKTLYAPIGMRFSELVKLCGGATVDEPAYLVGGPMMGKVGSERDAVTKTTNAIILLPKNHEAVMGRKLKTSIMLRRAMSACCQCHSCTDLCSSHTAGYPIEPHMIMRILSNGGKGDMKAILGSFSCSGCGICETYACPQSLSPSLLIEELKGKARELGVKPPKDARLSEPAKDEKLRLVSSERLTARLGLKKYDVPAPISDETVNCKKVRVPLDRYIGAPAKATVVVGDEVTCGQIIGAFSEKALSVNVHASIDGKITVVTDKFVEISRK
jgi:Na+-translocating ferredoxin:NAD+ oxidoreductase RnfC subunit